MWRTESSADALLSLGIGPWHLVHKRLSQKSHRVYSFPLSLSVWQCLIYNSKIQMSLTSNSYFSFCKLIWQQKISWSDMMTFIVVITINKGNKSKNPDVTWFSNTVRITMGRRAPTLLRIQVVTLSCRAGECVIRLNSLVTVEMNKIPRQQRLVVLLNHQKPGGCDWW